jgi:hypothetical protein
MVNGITDGLMAPAEEDRVHRLEQEGHAITVRQVCEKLNERLSVLDMSFSLQPPIRFTVGVRVPDNCSNACVTLNGQMLISWFSDDFPDDVPEAATSACQEKDRPLSTLRPGRVQSINFRWQAGDRLRFFWVWPAP